MFTILQCKDQRKGLAKLFVRRKYFFEMVSEKGVRFMVLTINDKDKIDWRRIENILGKTARKTLLAEDIPLPPDDVGISAPDTAPYAHRLACNAAEQILRGLTMEQKDIKVLLLDENAAFFDYARMTLKYCGRLKIVTARQEEYERFSETALEEYGAVTMVSDRVQNPDDNTLVLAPVLTKQFASSLPVGRKLHPLVISAVIEDGARVYGTMMTKFRASLPLRYLDYKPDKIDSFAYAAALYSCCNVSKLGRAIPSFCDVVADGSVIAEQVDFKG